MNPPRPSLRLARPAALPGLTWLRAEHSRQRFGRHSHEEYALGVITAGALGFDYRGSRHVAAVGELNLVIPGEPHTGEPAGLEPWSYRMLYLAPERLSQAASQLAGRAAGLPHFGPGVLRDATLASALLQLHAGLEAGDMPALEAESRLLALLAAWIARHGQVAPAARRWQPDLAPVRDYLEAHWADRPTLIQLAALAGLSPYRLLRAFARQFGLPPHAYLLQRQVREARRRLEAGEPPAQAALACGFADQSHLNRHFKRALGMTPGQYCNFVQDRRRP